MARLNPNEHIWFSSMGKLFEITAWFANDANANTYLAKHSDEGVIASTRDGLVLIANIRAAGVRYTRHDEARYQAIIGEGK